MMKRRTSQMLLGIAIFIATLLGPTCAFAATTTGNPYALNSNGIVYTGRASMSIDSSRATAKSEVTTTSPVPAGYIWTRVDLYENSVLKGTVSGTNKATLSIGYSTYYVSGRVGASYKAGGKFGAYNAATGGYTYANQYPTDYLPFTRSFALESSQALEPYSLTEEGDTYGSALGECSWGILPDWIEATATNGVSGYIKAEDFSVPVPRNPEDAINNFSVTRVKSIPVYLGPGSDEVVGKFDIYYGG